MYRKRTALFRRSVFALIPFAFVIAVAAAQGSPIREIALGALRIGYYNVAESSPCPAGTAVCIANSGGGKVSGIHFQDSHLCSKTTGLMINPNKGDIDGVTTTNSEIGECKSIGPVPNNRDH
jgi:hypothetical protein